MAQDYERELSIKRAAALLNAGYDDNYVQKKLVKEGLSQAEAAAIMQILTGKAAPSRKNIPIQHQPVILDDLSQNPFPPQNPASQNKYLEAAQKINTPRDNGASRRQAGVSQYQHLMRDLPQTKARDDDSEKREKQRIKGVLFIVVGIIVTIFATQSEDADASAYLTTIGMIITGIYSIVKSSSD